MSSELQQFFRAYDLEGSRSVDQETFRGLCGRFGISAKDSDVIFEDLDHDHDGRISFTDFSRGFSEYLSTFGGKDPEDLEQSAEFCTEEDTVKHHVWTALTTEAERTGKKNSDEGKLTWLLGELQMSEQRHLVPYLETAVEELLGNLKQLQEEKAQLEETWQREKQEHERHLKRMEEELDNQVKDVEMKLRLKAQAEVEDERKSLQSKMDAEMDNLQAHLVLFEKVNSWLQSHPSDGHDNRLDEVKTKLDEAVHENRQLRMSLLDTQTNIALVRSELLQLRTLYEEKCRELSSEREKILEVLHEQDHLTRQLNLLHDVNRRLQDANDSLRNSMENNNKTKQSISCSPYRNKSGSIVGDYLDHSVHPGILFKYKSNTDDEDFNDSDEGTNYRQPKLKKAKSMDFDSLPRQRIGSIDDVPDFLWTKPNGTPNGKAFEAIDRHLKNASDSGVSMAPDSLEVDYRSEPPPKCPKAERSLSYVDDSPAESPVKAVNYSDVNQSVLPPRNENAVTQSISPSALPPVQTSTPIKIATKPYENRANLINGYVGDMKGDTASVPAEEFPRRKISDIIKELGLKDTGTVRNYSSSSSSAKYRRPSEVYRDSSQQQNMSLPKSTEKTSPQQNMSLPPAKPVPRPRLSKLIMPRTSCQTVEADSKSEKRNGLPPVVANGRLSAAVSRVDPEEDSDVEVAASADELDTTRESDFEEESYEADGPAEETYKVVFVGDAGVGKSSFALRISKGVFVRQMSSTLGVDFLMRTLRVDGRNVAVQLWDTAGQERFRSITKSYFRKADGVLLLYDCTCEHSFLNVRQWVEDVDVACFYRLMACQTTSSERSASATKIPLMIVANKTDLRLMAFQTGERCVSTEEGEKLAKDCDTTFIEASAKDGSNVMRALAKLVRMMSSRHDLQMNASTMQLCEVKPKKGGCCGK